MRQIGLDVTIRGPPGASAFPLGCRARAFPRGRLARCLCGLHAPGRRPREEMQAQGCRVHLTGISVCLVPRGSRTGPRLRCISNVLSNLFVICLAIKASDGESNRPWRCRTQSQHRVPRPRELAVPWCTAHSAGPRGFHAGVRGERALLRVRASGEPRGAACIRRSLPTSEGEVRAPRFPGRGR